jgi:hypothetical protein
MRHKTLLIATLVLGLVALAVIRLNREAPPADGGKKPLVDAALLGQLKSVSVKANQKSVTVERTAAGWTVKDKLGLPADVENRLLPLIRGLQKANHLGLLTANAKRLEKLGLTDSSVTLTADDGKTTTIQFGKQTEDGVGASARLAGETAAIRTDFTGYLEADATSWVDFNLFVAKPADIRSVSFLWKDGKDEFVRKAAGAPFAGAGAQAAEEIVATLATLRAADAVALDDKEASKAPRSAQVKLGLFDGATVTLTFARLAAAKPNEPGKAFVRVEHSDPKHASHALNKQALFVAAPWLAEQVPASAADFRKSLTPEAAPTAAPLIPILGPSATPPAPLIQAK